MHQDDRVEGKAMSRPAGFVEISGSIYPAGHAYGETYFKYANSLLAYDPLRDGKLITEEDARKKYPEYFV